jgi:hypothetical protein
VHGSGAQETKEAEAQCSAAVATRYGRLSPQVAAAVVRERRRQLVAAALSRRMSVIAWDQASVAARKGTVATVLET